MIEESLYISNNLIFIVFDKTVEHISVSLAYTCIETKAILFISKCFSEQICEFELYKHEKCLGKKEEK